MVVQLLLGQAADAAGLRRQWDHWRRELAPGTAGWLSSTGGVTTDGRFLLATHFSSPQDAAAAGRRPEQARWWAGTAACLAGPPTLLETADVNAVHEANPMGAGFVQVMRGRARDRARFEAIEEEIGPAFLALRPDALGSYVAWFPDGTLAAIDYFSSEAEARAGESIEMPEELRAGFQEWLSLLDDLEWYDLTEPWLASPPSLTDRRPPRSRSMELTCRLATHDDIAVLLPLIHAAIDELQRGFLDDSQIQSSHAIMGVDSQLIEDGTYFVVESGGTIVGCGGWSRRATLYGGDHSAGRDHALLDPSTHPAKVRAMYTHPAFTRRGVGKLILSRCEAAAAAAGFTSLELMATMAGEPFYAASGFEAIERVEDPAGGTPVPLVKMRKKIAPRPAS